MRLFLTHASYISTNVNTEIALNDQILEYISTLEHNSALVTQGDRFICLLKTYLAWDKIWKDGVLSTSAISFSLYNFKGLLCFSVANYSPKACFFHAATKRAIIAVRSRLPMKRLR